MIANLTSDDWQRIDRLRATFLRVVAPGQSRASPRQRGPYWQDRRDLELYDATLATRIGWKWDAVVSEMKRVAWSPAPGILMDWGCGSGIAARKWVSQFGQAACSGIQLHDHSQIAMNFAAEQIKFEGFTGQVETLSSTGLKSDHAIGTLLLSHVGNELTKSDRNCLDALFHRSQTVIWVEPGTHADSRHLGEWRERWRKDFRIIAPCPHQQGCGMLQPGNERHWCHFFAPSPPYIHQDRDWARFARLAGIDLRSLPYSFLVLDRRPASTTSPAQDQARWIGRPRFYKAYARVFTCRPESVAEEQIERRTQPEEWARIERMGNEGIPD